MKKGLLLILFGMVLTLSGCKGDDVAVGVLFSLEGENQIDLYIGDTFVDAGFIATDSGVDISEHVTVNGTVDTSTEGTYFLEYILEYNEQTRMLLRTVSVTIAPLTDTEVSNEIFDDITIVSETNEDITLDDYNSKHVATIVWSSDTEAIITSAGEVTRPEFGLGNASVIMTATVTINSVEYSREFTVVVLEGEAPFSGVGTEIFISEYIEGSSYNKVIELFNPTGADITLDTYSLQLYFNGNDTTTSILALDGLVIPSGGTLIFSNGKAADDILALAILTDSYVINFNGNDAIGLYKNDVLIDLIGIIGVDPGDSWDVGDAATANYTLVRDPSVTGPTTTWDPAEWVAYEINTIEYLGSHDTD